MLKCLRAIRSLLSAVFVVFALLFCHAGMAYAEIKVHVFGDMDLSIGGYWNVPLIHEVGKSELNDDTFRADFRARLFLMAETSETTRMGLLARYAKARLGQKKDHSGDTGFQLDGDKSIIRIRQTWMEWGHKNDPWKFRGGLLVLRTPSVAFNSGIMDGSGAGMEFLYKLNDYITADLTWVRPYDDYLNDNAVSLHDEMDLFQLRVPINLPEHNMRIIPWGMYARIGKDSSFWTDYKMFKSGSITDDGTAWWAGGAFDYRLNKWRLKVDAVYGRLDTERSKTNHNTKGWQTFVKAEYKTDKGFVPGVFGWYATGSKAKEAERNRQWGYLPSITSFDIKFNATSFGFSDETVPGSGDIINDGYVGLSPGGTCGIGVQVTNISFVEGLEHLVRFTYYTGTNEKELGRTVSSTNNNLYLGRRYIADNTILTTGDHVFEVNFNHRYQLYPDAQILLRLGYIHLKRGSHWFADNPQYKHSKYDKNKNAWQVGLGFKYTFDSNNPW